MTGDSYTLVRPKTSQDSTKILAGSPLAIQGVFLEVLRERFRSTANIGYVWDPDPTISNIEIEASWNEETQARNNTPAVYVTRSTTVPSKVILGDRVGVRLPDQLEGFMAETTCNMSVDCVSNDEGESALLADTVQFTLLASSDVIQREFGFRDLSHPVMLATEPYPRDVDKWNTPVQFSVQFEIRWSQVPIRPLLQSIYARVTQEGTNIFQQSVLMSLRRGTP